MKEKNNILLDENEAAKKLKLKVQTLRNWRHLRKGPNYIRLGGRRFYREDDLNEFVNDRVVKLG